MLYTEKKLRSIAFRIFESMGFAQQQASLAADVLIEADLRGIDSHGVARLPGYVELWEKKRLNARPDIKIIHETPSTATLDADEGVGLISGPFAMKVAIDKAKQVGSGWVAVKNSNHFGIAGYHAMMALEHDMIGIALTNASPIVAPTYSIDKMLGTNPIAMAVPALEERPFIADLATSAVANGKLEVLQRQGKPAPYGWLQDIEGKPTDQPEDRKKGGALLPLGSDPEHSSHKGYCLGAIVDILSGVLSGANFGLWVPPFVSYLPLPDNPVGSGIGHFFGALRVDAFQDSEVFKKNMDIWIRSFKDAKAVEGKRVLVPGEIEFSNKEKRTKEGIPLLDSVRQSLITLSHKMHLNYNL